MKEFGGFGLLARRAVAGAWGERVLILLLLLVIGVAVSAGAYGVCGLGLRSGNSGRRDLRSGVDGAAV